MSCIGAVNAFMDPYRPLLAELLAADRTAIFGRILMPRLMVQEIRFVSELARTDRAGVGLGPGL